MGAGLERGGGENNRPQTDGFKAEKPGGFGPGRGWGSRSPTSFLPPLFDFVHLFFCLSQKAPNHHRGGEAAGPSRVPFAPLWAAKAVGLHRHNGVAGIHGPLPATSIHPPLAASIPIPAPASMPFPTTTRTASRRGLVGGGGRARHDPDPRSWDPSPPPVPPLPLIRGRGDGTASPPALWGRARWPRCHGRIWSFQAGSTRTPAPSRPVTTTMGKVEGSPL